MPITDIQIVLLCGGKGTRLEGMDLPKPLCTILGRPLLYYVLKSLPPEITLIHLFYSETLEKVQFEKVVKHSCMDSHCKIIFQRIPANTRGPVETALIGLHKQNLTNSSPVLFIDNDTINTFALTDFISDQLCIGTYRTQNREKPYAFLELDASGKKILHIKEKQGISNTYATGLYYFPSVTIFKSLATTLITTRPSCKEFFIGDLYASAIEQGLDVWSVPCESTIALGTPADIYENIHKVPKYPMRICFDIDNTLVSFSNAIGTTEGIVPIPHMVELLRTLHAEGNTIVLHTARGMKSKKSNLGLVGKGSILSVLTMLEEYKIPYDEIYFGKPWADLYVDDKAWNPYTNPTFSSFLFNYTPDTKLLCMDKGCSNNENRLYKNGSILIKEGPRTSLEGEIYFYEMTKQTPVASLLPVFHSKNSGSLSSYFEMGFVEGTPVSQLFRNGLLTKQILTSVIDTIQTLHSAEAILGDGQISKDDLIENYIGKLKERVISHKHYKLDNIMTMVDILSGHIKQYVYDPSYSITPIVHGDPWFDNMIYSYGTNSVKLLDMKGKLGSILSLKGDRLTDYAKLYQSVLGFDYYLHGEHYPSDYEATCRAWLQELLPISIEDPVFESITACCILKTFYYFSKSDVIAPIYNSLKKLALFRHL